MTVPTAEQLASSLPVALPSNRRRGVTAAQIRGWLNDTLTMVDARLAAGEQARADLAVMLAGYRAVIDGITEGAADATERIEALESFVEGYAPAVTQEEIDVLAADIAALQDSLANTPVDSRPYIYLVDTTPADNVGTSESTLFEATSPGGTMPADGTVIESKASGIMLAHPNATRTLKLYIDNNLVYATAAVKTTTLATWEMRATTIRTSSSTATILLNTIIGGTYENPTIIPLTGVDFSHAGTVKLTGQAGGNGAGSGQIRCNVSFSLVTVPVA